MSRLVEAIRHDLAWTAANRWQPLRGRSRVRQIVICAGLLGQSRIGAVLLYRLRQELRRRHVPLLPALCDRLAMLGWNVCIGAHTAIGPGLYLPHGNVVIDGMVRIGRRCVIAPWVTIGVDGSVAGPTIGDNVFIGTGAKILGGVTIGDGARIGANAVVLRDVPAGATAVGVPARVVGSGDTPPVSPFLR